MPINFLEIAQLKLTVFHLKLYGTEESSTKPFKKSSHTWAGGEE